MTFRIAILSWCGLFLATSVSSAGSAAPMVRVVRAASAPTVDGRDNDPAWKMAISVVDFIVPGSHRPLQEKTEVRLLWDKDNLYVYARLDESILSVASQMQNEIKAGAKNRDDAVIDDDSFLLILRPEGSKSAWEFGVNTRGVLADGKSDPADLWEARDYSWNGQVQVAALMDDGFWAVEMAIPWKELGMAAPAVGTQWQTVIGRHAAARRASGSWNPSGKGIHDPVSWGQLVFGESVAGVQPTPLLSLESGKNELKLLVTPPADGKANLVVGTKITPDQKGARPVRSRETVGFSGKDAKAFTHDFKVDPSGGVVNFAWSLSDSASLEPLYQSPEIAMEILSSSVTLQISASAPWRLLVNDAEVAAGQAASDQAVKIALRSGANLLALETQSGTARLRLDSPDLGEAPIRWKMRLVKDPAALQASADDSQWTTAPESEAGEIGQNGTPMVLRHTVLLQSTRIFPAPIPALYIAGSGVQAVTFTAFGVAGKPLKDWKVFLELPPSVEAMGATGYYGNILKKPRFTLQPKQDHRYVIEADAPVTERPKGGNPILSLFNVVLRQSGADPSDGDMKHYGRANDDTVSELTQSTLLRLLPAAQGEQPKKLIYQIWADYLNQMDNPEMRDAIAETAQKAGFNEMVSANTEQVARFSLQTVHTIHFASYSMNLGPWLQEHPDDRLIDREAKPSDSLMCTTVLLDRGWKEAGAPALKTKWESTKPDVLDYDYEYPALNGPHSCYCPRCLQAFRVAAGLPDDLSLDAKIIQEQHSDQWVDFMARRVAQLFLLMKNTVHELPGDVKFEIYSGYQTPDNATRYGVNWHYVGELDACDRAGMGYGYDDATKDETLLALGKIPAVFGELVTPYMIADALNFSTRSHQVTKANLLRRFIDATGGTLIYHTQNMDGRSWLAAAEISRLVAKHEELFGTQRAKTLPGQPKDELAILETDEIRLVSFMNLGNEEKNFSFDFPADWNVGKEFYTGRIVQPGERIQLTLPPGDAAVFLVDKNRK